MQLPGGKGEGHFGLAVQDYTHSTAPNRRFADLVTQRLVKAAVAGKAVPYSADELKQIAEHCTEREAAARKVERKMRKVASAVLLRDQVGHEFKAIVTGVSEKGTFARVLIATSRRSRDARRARPACWGERAGQIALS